MQKLDIWHHKLIVMLMMVAVFIGGILFGVKLSGTTAGTDGLSITIFAMLSVSIVLSFITFTQIIHLRDDIELRKRR